MNHFPIKAAMLALVTGYAATAFPLDVSAAPRSAYAAKKAECKDRAKQMKFGVHLIKKSRWVKDCIAGDR